jgi:hypothetical protein
VTEAFKEAISGDGKVAATRRTALLGLLLRSDLPNSQQKHAICRSRGRPRYGGPTMMSENGKNESRQRQE